MNDEKERYRERLGEVSESVLALRLTKDGDVVVVGDIIELAIEKAAGKAYNAGMSGSWGDGGASSFIDSVRAWVDGLENRIPTEFDDLLHEHLKAKNPDEYAEFLRLQEKYGT